MPAPLYEPASVPEPDLQPVSQSGAAPVPLVVPATRGSRVIYPLRKIFNWDRCHDLSQRYKLVVNQNREKGPEAQSLAVKAVPHHELDYPASSVAEKIEYHQYCGEWCEFKAWESQKKPLDKFKREKTKDLHGNEVKWEGGLLAKFKIEYAEAYKGLLGVFETLGNIELMSRCSQILTQNINESVHARMWKHCLKIKPHGIDRYVFCAKHVVLAHNFGHYASSLHHIMGSMTKELQETLKKYDIESQRVATKKYVLKKGGKKTNRVKKVVSLHMMTHLMSVAVSLFSNYIPYLIVKIIHCIFTS